MTSTRVQDDGAAGREAPAPCFEVTSPLLQHLTSHRRLPDSMITILRFLVFCAAALVEQVFLLDERAAAQRSPNPSPVSHFTPHSDLET